MDAAGDSTFSENYSEHNSLVRMNDIEDSEVRPPESLKTRFKKNLLTNAHKSFHVLEHQTLVDCLEADKEFIISAGRDHNINIWDTIEGRHVRRLSGHTAPVTGLSLYVAKEPPFEKMIVSCSEDETVIQWSLNKGEQLLKIQTKNVVTCLGIMNRRLAVVGNHKGYMEIYHLFSGDLYSTILAHLDPIDALAVNGNHVCSAVFEAPSSLKVWEVQFEQIKCVYRLENLQGPEFSSLAMWDTKAMLGLTNQQKLLVVDFKTGGKGVIDLERPRGRLRQVRVWKEWILSCSSHEESVLLDVHRIHNFEHFGTFNSNMSHVTAIAAVEFDNSFKVILGGSALAVLSFDFVLTEEDIRTPFNSSMNIHKRKSFEWNKTVSPYTIKYPLVEQNESFCLDKDTSADEEMSHDGRFSHTSTPRSNRHELHDENFETQNVEKCDLKNIRALSVLTVFPGRCDELSFDHEKSRLERMLQICTEPRAAMRKLEQLLDHDELPKELEKCSVTKEIERAAEYDAPDMDEPAEPVIEEFINEEPMEETFERMSETAEKDQCDAETVTERLNLLKMDDNELNEAMSETEELLEEIESNKKYIKKFCLSKKQKCKKDKKKQTEKSKHKKCLIM